MSEVYIYLIRFGGQHVLRSSFYFILLFCPWLPFISLFAGCLTWHCRVEPKVGDRIPGMKYDTLMPEDIKPYLNNGRSWKDLKVGDEIAFPEPDGSAPTAESLVGLSFTYEDEYQDEEESMFKSFDAKTGMHAFEDGDAGHTVINLQNGSAQFKKIKFEGSDAYFASGLMLGLCTIGELVV